MRGLCHTSAHFHMRDPGECSEEFAASGHAPAGLDRGDSSGGRKGTYRSLWFRGKPVTYFCAGKQYSRGHRYQRENGTPYHHGNSESIGCGFFPGSQQNLCRRAARESCTSTMELPLTSSKRSTSTAMLITCVMTRRISVSTLVTARTKQERLGPSMQRRTSALTKNISWVPIRNPSNWKRQDRIFMQIYRT